jgi:hypothetical protein
VEVEDTPNVLLAANPLETATAVAEKGNAFRRVGATSGAGQKVARGPKGVPSDFVTRHFIDLVSGGRALETPHTSPSSVREGADMGGDPRSAWGSHFGFAVRVTLRSVIFKLKGLGQKTADELGSDRDEVLSVSAENLDLNVAGMEGAAFFGGSVSVRVSLLPDERVAVDDVLAASMRLNLKDPDRPFSPIVS